MVLSEWHDLLYVMFLKIWGCSITVLTKVAFLTLADSYGHITELLVLPIIG